MKLFDRMPLSEVTGPHKSSIISVYNNDKPCNLQNWDNTWALA